MNASRNRRAAIAILGSTLTILLVALAAYSALMRDDWKRLSLGAIELEVPGDWQVMRDVQLHGVCPAALPRSFVAVESEPPKAEPSICPGALLGDLDRLSLEVQPISALTTGDKPGELRPVGETTAYLIDDPRAQSSDFPSYAFDIRDHDVRLVFWGDNPELREKILNTVQVR